MSLFDSIGKIIAPESSRPYIKNTKLNEDKVEFTKPLDIYQSMSETTEETSYSVNPEYKGSGVVKFPKNTSKLVKKEAVLKSGTVITDDLHGVTITHPDGSSNKYPGELFLNYCKDKSCHPEEISHDLKLEVLNGKIKEHIKIGYFGHISNDLQKSNSSYRRWSYNEDDGYRGGGYNYRDSSIAEGNDGTLQINLTDSYGWGGNVIIYKPAISKQDVTPANKREMENKSADLSAMDKMLITDNQAKNNKITKPANIKNRFLPL